MSAEQPPPGPVLAAHEEHAQQTTAPPPNTDAIEDAKRRAAIRAVDDYFSPSYRYVGIGSGSTIQYVVEAIKAICGPTGAASIRFVPTGYQSRSEIESRGLTSVSFDSLPEGMMLDVAFDGADEVDPELNCVKGGGACLFQEKLVAMRAKRFVCVADFRKAVPRLLTNWTYIPIEVAPIAVAPVLESLRALGCPNPALRMLDVAKQGPLKTDQDFYIIKAPFPPLLPSPSEAILNSDLAHPSAVPDGVSRTEFAETAEGQKGRVWDATSLARAIKSISGVLEVGLFVGTNGPDAEKLKTSTRAGEMAAVESGQKPVAAYFGMQDGSVMVKKAPGEP